MVYLITNKKLIILGLLLLLFANCNKKPKTAKSLRNNDSTVKNVNNLLHFKYKYFKYQTNHDLETYDFPLKLELKSNGDTSYYLKYIIDKSSYIENRASDTIEFFFDRKNTISGKKVTNSSHSEMLYLVAHRLFHINNEKYDVYKLRNSPNGLVDNGLEFIWVPKFGVIIEKSIHWLNFYKFEMLLENEESKELTQLFEAIYNDIDDTFKTER